MLHIRGAGLAWRYSKVMGSLWVATTAEILQEAVSSSNMLQSFVLHAIVSPELSSLGSFDGVQ